MNRTTRQIYGLKKNLIKTFVSTWDTTKTTALSSGPTQIRLPLESTGTYNFVVDWGDGQVDTITTWNAAAATHTYATAGIKTISITGIIRGFSFGGLPITTTTTDKLKILSISKWGPLRLGNSGSYFNTCSNITLNTITDILDLTGTTTLAFMFFECRLITTVGRMNEWNTSNITNMTSMFHVTGASTNGVGLFNQNIGNWDVSKVTSFNTMFRFTALFNNGGSDSIKNWNVSSAIDMGAMFSRANSFNQPIANWERTSPDVSTLVNVVDMNNMFSSGNRPFSFNQPIGNWNVSNVTNMNSMFYRSPFNQDIGAWNISKVTNLASFGVAQDVSPFSPATVDAIYNGWSTRSVVPGLTITFSSKSTINGAGGKVILQTTPKNWIVNDGGVL